MPIRIEKIAIQNLGPLRDFDMELGVFSLIYGWNETGKTYLVEFILRSVFRDTSHWSLRDTTASGKVTVSGVQENPVTFTPQSGDRLEDYWDQDDRGLPANMARLLVVKGAEIAMAQDTPGGVNRAILKSYLSRNELVDAILDEIPVTLQQARVVEATIEGSRRTDIKTRQGLLEDRKRIEMLYKRIDELYSGGPRRELELRKESLEHERECLLQAKHHLAYSLDRQIKELQSQRARLPKSELTELRHNFDAYQRQKGELSRKEERLQSLREESENYEWLELAISVYESRSLERGSGPRLAVLLSGGGLLMGGAIALLLELSVVGIVLFVLGAVLVGLYVHGLRGQVDAVQESDELRRLSRDYEQRFGEELSSLAELNRRKSQLQEKHIKARGLADQCEELRDEIDDLSAEIAGMLRSLTDEDHESAEWHQVITELEEQAEELDGDIQDTEVELARLDVKEEEYSTEEPSREFDPDQLEAVEEGLDSVEQDLRQAKDALASLKQEICNETGDDISAPWPEVLESLQQKRREVEDDYRQVTAGILAQIKLTEVLEEVRETENEKIREGLNLDCVTDPLLQITGKYGSLDLVDDQLRVSSPYRDYPLSDLSTGAQEQVLLALRMGFASHLAGGEPLFLVLDDAFQYADWQRRAQLINEVVGLTKSGWQIVYLTMDDYLRDLFLETGHEQFGQAFSYKELRTDEARTQGPPDQESRSE